MLWVYLLLMMCALTRADWPPTCDSNTKIVDNVVELTSETTKMSECSFAELFEDEIFIRFSRFYNSKTHVYKQASDSRIALSVKSKTNRKLFGFSIHSDKIQSENNRCFGIFQQKQPFLLKLSLHAFMDLRKTVVSVATSKNGDTFRYCFQFEIDEVIDKYKLEMGAHTESGMEQRIHMVDSSPPKEQGLEQVRKSIDKINKRLNQIDMKVWKLDDRLAEKNIYHDEMYQNFNNKHQEIKKNLKSAEVRNDLNVRHYSYFFLFLFCMLIVMGIAAIKFVKYYIHKRDKIF